MSTATENEGPPSAPVATGKEGEENILLDPFEVKLVLY